MSSTFTSTTPCRASDVDDQLDGVRLLPGASGLIDISAFLRALDGIGYEGPVAVEPFSAELAAKPAPERVRLAAQSLTAVFCAAGLVRPA